MSTEQPEIVVQEFENYVPADPDDPDSEAVWDGTWAVFSTAHVGRYLEVRAVKLDSTDLVPSLPGDPVWWVELHVQHGKSHLHRDLTPRPGAGQALTYEQALAYAQSAQADAAAQKFANLDDLDRWVAAHTGEE